MRISILDIPFGLGAGVAGSEDAPAALRRAGLTNRLRADGHLLTEARLAPAPGAATHDVARLKHLPLVVRMARGVARAVDAPPASDRLLLLGGDHSIALGTLPALSRRAARAGRPLFVLWIDAHPDCHSFATTESGHLHGTPVAHALGRPGFAPGLPPMAPLLDPSRLLGLGIRSVDPAETRLIDSAGLRMMGPGSLRQAGVAESLAPFLAEVRRLHGWLHVSLDADALDPADAPGVGTPVADGLRETEVAEVMACVAASGMLASLELVELNPHLDDGRTAAAMVRLAAAVFDERKAADRQAA
jgi:arginase